MSMAQEVTTANRDEALYLTYKARIYPNSEQRRAIAANIENNRYVHNLMITYCRLHLDGYGRLPSRNDLVRFGTLIWKRCHSFHDMYQNSMNETARRVLISYKGCLEKARAVAVDGTVAGDHGRPRYRKTGCCRSYGYPSSAGFSIREMDGRHYIRLGKVAGGKGSKGKGLRLHGPDIPKGTPKTCTVSRTDMGTHYEYHVSVVFRMDPGYCRGEVHLEKEQFQLIGIDVGISNLAAFSDGTVFENSREYVKGMDRFRRIHRRYSKTLPYTRENLQWRSRLNHAYKRLVNRRKNLIDRIAHDAVHLYDGIAMENLDVKQLRSRSLSRRMTDQYNDASIGRIRTRIADVAASARRRIVLVDPRGTSQICSGCGRIVRKDLGTRVHSCPDCGLAMDRDVNAAINILNRGWACHPDPVRWSNRPALGHIERYSARSSFI